MIRQPSARLPHPIVSRPGIRLVRFAYNNASLPSIMLSYVALTAPHLASPLLACHHDGLPRRLKWRRMSLGARTPVVERCFWKTAADREALFARPFTNTQHEARTRAAWLETTESTETVPVVHSPLRAWWTHLYVFFYIYVYTCFYMFMYICIFFHLIFTLQICIFRWYIGYRL